MESDNRRDSLEITDLRRLRTLARHARGQGFKSPILHCGFAAIEQEGGESSEESIVGPARAPAVYYLLSPLNRKIHLLSPLNRKTSDLGNLLATAGRLARKDVCGPNVADEVVIFAFVEFWVFSGPKGHTDTKDLHCGACKGRMAVTGLG
jgi:hypothetical protein